MRRPLAHSLVSLAGAAGLALLAACGGEAGKPVGGDGKFRVLLTDAPFPYDSVESVNVWVAGVSASTTADTTNPDGIQWQPIAEPNRAFDLLELQAGATAILGEAELPAGQYRAVRIVLDTEKSSVIDKKGQPMRVLWPSSQGRVALHALVEDAVDAGAGGSVVIDVDVGRSFICPYENCGRTLIFIPWFRAVNTAATGSISGRVLRDSTGDPGRPVANATVSVMRSNDLPGGEWVVATGATNAQGQYKVPFLRPGGYKVRVDPPRGANLGALSRDAIAVTAGAETGSVNFTLQARPPGSATVMISSIGGNTVQVGDTLAFTAYVIRPGPDSLLQNWTATWTSSATSVMTVAPTAYNRGKVRAVAPGTATVTAAVNGIGSASTLVTVVPRRELVEVLLNLPRTTYAVGDSIVAAASGRDASGQPVTGATFTFTVSDAEVVGVRGVYSGLYFVGWARKKGTATIRATSEGKSAEGTITVQ